MERIDDRCAGAIGARLLDRSDLAQAADKAAGFLRAELWDRKRLFRSHRGRRGDVPGFPADYAFLISGLLDLQALPRCGKWLAWAEELQARMDLEFWEEDAVGYVMRSELGGETLMRIREEYDGAEPATNHVAACNLLKLSALTGDTKRASRAELLLHAGCATLETGPFGARSCWPRMIRWNVVLCGSNAVVSRSMSWANGCEKTYLPETVWKWSEGNGDVILCSGEHCSVPIRTVSEWDERWGPACHD